MVAKEFTQTYGINISFAQVEKLNTVWVILSLVANLDWSLKQLDIMNVFVNDKFDEEIFMTVPLDFCKQGEENAASKLKKSLYGLKQSPRAWFDWFAKITKS